MATAGMTNSVLRRINYATRTLGDREERDMIYRLSPRLKKIDGEWIEIHPSINLSTDKGGTELTLVKFSDGSSKEFKGEFSRKYFLELAERLGIRVSKL